MCIRVKLPGGDIGQLVSAVNLPVKQESPLLLSAPVSQAKPQVSLILMGIVVVGKDILLCPLSNLLPVVEGEEEKGGRWR